MLLASGQIAVGVLGAVASLLALWACGTVTWPASTDSYLRRASRVLRDWDMSLRVTYANAERESVDIAARLASRRVPDGVASYHAEIVESLRAADALRYDRSVPLVERARRLAEEATRLDLLEERVGGAAVTESEKAYVEAVRHVRDRRRQVNSAAAREAGRSTDEMTTRLLRVKPPPTFAGAHQELLERLRAYAEAYASLREAYEADNGSLSSASARTLDERRRALHTCLREFQNASRRHWAGRTTDLPP